jgi:hypothetical protein
MTSHGLHLDHEPPLTPLERSNPVLVCDFDRVQLLCGKCHANKTITKGKGGITKL